MYHSQNGAFSLLFSMLAGILALRGQVNVGNPLLAFSSIFGSVLCDKICDKNYFLPFNYRSQKVSTF